MGLWLGNIETKVYIPVYIVAHQQCSCILKVDCPGYAGAMGNNFCTYVNYYFMSS